MSGVLAAVFFKQERRNSGVRRYYSFIYIYFTRNSYDPPQVHRLDNLNEDDSAVPDLTYELPDAAAPRLKYPYPTRFFSTLCGNFHTR